MISAYAPKLYIKRGAEEALGLFGVASCSLNKSSEV
jgi:hypothetical protein